MIEALDNSTKEAAEIPETNQLYRNYSPQGRILLQWLHQIVCI